MRIIAGTARSLPLKTIEGMDTRPTTDKIKETLFNILQGDVPGADFLDLFAGSGQIGLEALSRGARYAVFVESGRRAAKCIEENIAFTRFTEQSRLLQMDVMAALSAMEGRYRFDLVYMDPPYRQGLEESVFAGLGKSSLLKEDALVICEASADTFFDYLPEYGFELVRCKRYKNNAHFFVEKREVR